MAKTRSAYHHGDLANALVRVSLALVEERGVEEFSLRAAAAHCGVAVSAAYRHFAARGALLGEVADLGFESLADDMTARVARATRNLRGTARAEAALVELGRTYILFAIAHPRLFRLMYGPRGEGGADASRRPDPPARRIAVLLVEAIGEVQRAYGRPPANLDAHKVIAWSLVHGFAMMVVEGLWKQKSRRALDTMIAELGAATLRSLRPV